MVKIGVFEIFEGSIVVLTFKRVTITNKPSNIQTFLAALVFTVGILIKKILFKQSF